MYCKDMEQIKRSYNLDVDLAESFAEWVQARGLVAGPMVQLGIYLVMHLEAGQRERLLMDMVERRPVRVKVGEAEETGAAGQHSGAEPSKAKRRDAG
jgi:hypothetical protein